MPIPTGRLALVVALASVIVAGLPVDAALSLLIVDGALLVIALVDWALAVPPARIPVERDLPGVLALDGAGEVVWRVRNPTGRRLRVAVADELAPSLRAGRRRVRVTVPRHGAVEASTTIRPTRRGRFTPTEV